jgi:cell shape-determining protein MreC
MNYLLKSSNFEDRRRSAKKRILLVTIILIIIILIIIFTPIRAVLFSVAVPVWRTENYISNSNFLQYFKSKQSLINERIALEQKLFMTGNLMALNETLQAENDSLKDLLGRKETKSKSVLAAVLVKPPQTPYDTLIIDIGENYNIKVGDKVIANANVYIGEVNEVQAHSSKVLMYSTPGHKLSVVLGASSVTAEAVGVGGGNFNIFLPREVEVNEGEAIVIPAITANIFGIVEKVNFNDKDSVQTVLFKSPVNISELSFVEVVIN